MSRTCRLTTMCVTLSAFLSAVSRGDEPPNAEKDPISIVIDADKEVGEIYNFWDVFPVTVQKPFLDSEQHTKLRETYRYAKYINCVRFLGGINLEKDDYFRGLDEDGEAVCDFTEGIAMLAGIRQCGFTPWIVLDNVPAAMCERPVKNRYGNTEPPGDFKVWQSYVRQLVQTLVDNFGKEEVLKWRFRVGTEPDLNPGHWTGTKEQYLAHYDHSVAAVHAALPSARVGPGNIIDPVKKRRWRSWGTEIIDHCATGKNYATGEVGTPMSFFASSYYTAVGTTDARFEQLITTLRHRLAKYPQFSEVPVEIQEFGILSEGGKWIVGDGTEFGGSWMAHFADKIYDLRVPRVYQWWWNTNKGGGIPVPLNHVLDMLQGMVGGARLSCSVSRSSDEDHVGCIAARNDSGIDLIVFRHLAVRDNGQAVPVRVTLRSEMFDVRSWKVVRANIINGEHAGFMHLHQANLAKARAEAGEDADPFAIAFSVMARHREEYESQSALSTLKPSPELTVDVSGALSTKLMLDGHSVIHLRLE